MLRQTELFGRVSDSELTRIARVVKERRLKRNQVLFRQGDEADALYVIESGRLRVSATDRLGRERVLAFLGAGEVVGEMGLVAGAPRAATVVASTDADLLQLRKRDFDVFVARNMDAMRELARAVGRRREATQKRVHDETTGRGFGFGLVTVVFSPRGGGGTTTLATNLAVALAQRAPDQVVLMDLNLTFGHVPVLLNLTSRTSLAAISAVSLRGMDRENLEFYLTRHADSSLRVMSGALRPEQSELVTTEHAAAAIEAARKHFAHVVVDLARNFSEVNLQAVESAHNFLVICTPDAAGLRGVTESQRIFRELVRLPGDPMQYVVNHPTPYAQFSVEQVQDKLGIMIVAEIPFGGEAVARAALEGQPLVLRSPGSPTSKAINHIADLLHQQLAEARALAPAEYVTAS